MRILSTHPCKSIASNSRYYIFLRYGTKIVYLEVRIDIKIIKKNILHNDKLKTNGKNSKYLPVK